MWSTMAMTCGNYHYGISIANNTCTWYLILVLSSPYLTHTHLTVQHSAARHDIIITLVYTYSTLTWSAWHHVTNTLVTLVSVSLSILTPHRHLTSLHKASRQQECGCHLESQQQQERLNAVEASVNKVAHKQIVCVRNVSADFEEFFEVIKLAMDVTTHLQHTHTHTISMTSCHYHTHYTRVHLQHTTAQHDMTSREQNVQAISWYRLIDLFPRCHVMLCCGVL